MVEHLKTADDVTDVERLSDFVVYGKYNGVDVWDIENMSEAMETGELDDGEEHFNRVASQDDVESVIVIVGGEDLGKGVLEHVASQWTQLAEETGINATAYVADGMSRLAISQKNQADIATKGFKDLDSAVDWIGRQS